MRKSVRVVGDGGGGATASLSPSGEVPKWGHVFRDVSSGQLKVSANYTAVSIERLLSVSEAVLGVRYIHRSCEQCLSRW